MIQRIQTVWLLLAAVAMTLVFAFPSYQYTGATSALPISIGNDFIGIILAALSIVLSLVAVFNFKKRKQQISLTWLNILLAVGLQVWMLIRIQNENALPEKLNLPGHYWIGLFMPLLTIIFLFLAKGGINKDEKLVKSLDRLR
jgi:hypothetical protein